MGITLVDKPEVTESKEDTGSELWGRNRLHPWRIRIAALAMAFVLIAGVATVAVVTSDTKTASAATTCPSTNLQYYRDRHWAPCLWGAEKYWANGLYICTVSLGQLHTSEGKPIQTFLSVLDSNHIRACQDQFYNLTQMAQPLKNYYITDLYKLSVAAQQSNPQINAYTSIYYNWFYQVGTNWPAVSTAGQIGVCGTLVAGSGLGSNPYTAWVATAGCAWGWRYAFDQGH